MEGSDFTSKGIIKAFRLSEAEAMNLANSAACHGMKESNYIRKCIARGPKDNKEIVILLHDLMNELQRIGRNINQIVKNNNSGLYRVCAIYRGKLFLFWGRSSVQNRLLFRFPAGMCRLRL